MILNVEWAKRWKCSALLYQMLTSGPTLSNVNLRLMRTALVFWEKIQNILNLTFKETSEPHGFQNRPQRSSPNSYLSVVVSKVYGEINTYTFGQLPYKTINLRKYIHTYICICILCHPHGVSLILWRSWSVIPCYRPTYITYRDITMAPLPLL